MVCLVNEYKLKYAGDSSLSNLEKAKLYCNVIKIQGGPKVGIQLLKQFLSALKLHAVHFMLLLSTTNIWKCFVKW